MRLRIRLQPQNDEVTIPIHYNSFIQALIYRHLDRWLSDELHDVGFKDPLSKRHIKFFTFSRLLSKEKKVKGGFITFKGDIHLILSSPNDEFIQSFASNLLKNNEIRISDRTFYIQSIEVEPLPEYREKVLIRVLSPITIYSTLFTPDGRKKTYYYSPFEEDFSSLIIKNLERKFRTWYGSDIEAHGSIRPYRVNSKNQRIVLYENTVIKGWDGIYELCLPKELFKMAFEAGLGAKNSLGFGCIDLYIEGAC
ncbi:MAG: CRISPR-associated endoribonuclease Cas6 [Thermosulfidibacteraceae bacterium]